MTVKSQNFFLLLFVLCQAAIVVALYLAPRLQEPAFVYLDDSGNAPTSRITRYIPERGVVCAGDSLLFNLRLVVNDVPSVRDTAVTIRNRETGKALLGFRLDTPDIPYTFPVSFTTPITFTTPISITPGLWMLENVASEYGREPSAYQVPFQIKECYQ